MAEISKPDYRYVWSSGGANVSPSNTKIQTGWLSEVPPYQWENYLQNRQDNMLVHINQHGIPRWDALTEYFGVSSYVTGSDGQVYRSVQNSGPNTTTQDPVTDASDTYWRLAFADAGANYLTQTTGDARYLQRSLNGSDIANTTTFKVNIGVVPASTSVAGLAQIATNSEVVAGTNAVKYVTPASLTNALQGFTSADIILTPGSQTVISHNLGYIPKYFRVKYKCVIAQAGWAVGDVFDTGVWRHSTETTALTYGVYVYGETSTQVTVGMGNGNSWYFPAKTTGAATLVTLTNWRAILEVRL